MSATGILRRAVGRLRGKAEARDYLAEQVTRSAAKERRVLEALGVDGDVVDLGCGPGHFTALLAEWFGDARIVALDRDAAMLAQAKTRLAAMGSRVTIDNRDAAMTGLADASCDVVVTRLLFQHLSDPAAVLREALRILRPGGRLIITDVDDAVFGVVEPAVPELNRAFELYGAVQRARGGDRRIVRRLPALLRDAGFVDVDVDAVASHLQGVDGQPSLPQLDAAPLDHLRRSGAIDAVERDRLGKARTKLCDADAIALLFMVHARKPIA